MTELGVYIGNNASGVRQFESWLGKPVDSVLGYTGTGSWSDADPAWNISAGVGPAGRDIHWSIPMFPDTANDVAEMRSVAAGQHQADFTKWAREILAADSGTDPIYVRTAWELGGEWFYWTGAAKADPAAFKQAFQNFAKAFHDVSPRFKIVWDTVADRGPQEGLYPGDAAVDVISQDTYWHPQWDGNNAAAAFAHDTAGLSRGLDWIANFAAQHGKPIAIPEWGVPGTGTLDGATYINLLKDWMATHNVAYADYWNSTAAYDGLLSDGSPSATANALKALYSGGSGGTPTPTPTPGGVTLGTGPDALVLKISQDAYQGSAQYTVKVDGRQIGGVQTATALHSSDATDQVMVKGNWAPGKHTASVTFLNDAYGGTPATDRNLYVEDASYNGRDVLQAERFVFGNSATNIDFSDTSPIA